MSARQLLAGLRTRLRRLRFGFLTIPGLTVAGFAAMAFVTLALDRGAGSQEIGFGVARDADAARTVLNVIAASLITVAGVTFSITMVTLQLVSQQFTPRALRGFLGDRLNQIVAGVFIGVFVFSLLVVRTVQAPESGGEPFIPAISVTVAIVMAVVALVLLLVFIDHMGRKIQVSTIASDLAQGALSAVDRVYPEPYGRPVEDDPAELVRGWRAERDPEIVGCDRPGYIQSVTIDDLPRDVGSPGLRVEMRVTPGDFVTERDELAAYWPGEEDRGIGHALRMAVVIADERDLRQDPGYGIRQLADIAMKAVSPGVNDPTTAWTCIRYIQAVMERLADRDLPEPVRRYDDVGVTVVTRPVDFHEYVDAGFAQVGRYATDARVAGALLEAIERTTRIAAACEASARVAVLVRAAEEVAASFGAGDANDCDRAEVDRRLGRVRAAAGGGRDVSAASPG